MRGRKSLIDRQKHAEDVISERRFQFPHNIACCIRIKKLIIRSAKFAIPDAKIKNLTGYG